MWAGLRFALIVLVVAVVIAPFASTFFLAMLMAMSDSPAAAEQSDSGWVERNENDDSGIEDDSVV